MITTQPTILTILARVHADPIGSPCRVAEVTWQNSGLPVPRRADEGGTFRGTAYYCQRAAAAEAEERALRAAGGDATRIIRTGYTLDDVREFGALLARVQG